jgi:hypothetical protein
MRCPQSTKRNRLLFDPPRRYSVQEDYPVEGGT